MTGKTFKYGMRVMIHFARGAQNRTVKKDDLALDCDIPKNYCGAVLTKLSAASLVIGVQGTGGGYRLLRAPNLIDIASIYRAMSGPLARVPCISRTQPTPCSDCPDPLDCRIRAVMQRALDCELSILEAIKLSDLVGANALNAIRLKKPKTRRRRPAPPKERKAPSRESTSKGATKVVRKRKKN